jgi:DNA-binding CsgD family transcriptional regulator
MISLPDFNNVIGHLYDAASNTSSWLAFLRTGSSYFGAFGAHLIHLDKANPELSISYVVGFEQHSLDIQRAAMRKQMELESEDPRFHYARRFPNMPFRCTDIMPSAEFRALRIYRELLQPNGIEYSLMVQYSDSAEDFTGLAFFRSAEAGPYSEEDSCGLGDLIPHLRRTLSIQRRLFQLDHRLDASYQILESLPSGLVIVDEQGRSEFANAAALHIFSDKDGLDICSGKLQARPQQQAELLAIIRQTIDLGRHGAIALVRPSGKPAIQCVVTRLAMNCGESPANLIARPRAAVYLADPTQPLETPEQLLQRIFGLTQAEARILERLVYGRTPEQAASDNGVELSTVRTQLKSIFAKTNTTRQPELVQRVLASPIWMARKT